jgi:hypothetical protein
VGIKDGVFDCSGPRTVRKGGRVKFDGWWYQANQLSARTGQLVWIESADIWGGTPTLNAHELQVARPANRRHKHDKHVAGEWICYINREPGQETIASDEDDTEEEPNLWTIQPLA